MSKTSEVKMETKQDFKQGQSMNDTKVNTACMSITAAKQAFH